MKLSYIIPLLFIVGCSSKIDSQNNDNWGSPFETPEKEFKINFLDEPQKRITDNWPESIMYIDSGDIDNILYSISYEDHENNMYHSDSINNIEFDLQYTQKEFVKKHFLLLMKQPQPISILGYPGAEFRYKTYNDTKAIRVRVFFVRNRVYKLIVETEMIKNYNKSINQFFESFELLNTNPNIPSYLNLPSQEELKLKRYSIEYPTQAENKQNKVVPVNTAWGKSAYIMDMLQTNPDNIEEEKNLVYGVGYAKMPKKENLTSEDFKLLSKELKSNLLRSYGNAKLLGEKDVKVQNANGIEIQLEFILMDIPMEMIVQLFYYKNLCYQLQVMTPKDFSNNSKINTFLNSFKIIPQKND